VSIFVVQMAGVRRSSELGGLIYRSRCLEWSGPNVPHFPSHFAELGKLLRTWLRLDKAKARLNLMERRLNRKDQERVTELLQLVEEGRQLVEEERHLIKKGSWAIAEGRWMESDEQRLADAQRLAESVRNPRDVDEQQSEGTAVEDQGPILEASAPEAEEPP